MVIHNTHIVNPSIYLRMHYRNITYRTKHSHNIQQVPARQMMNTNDEDERMTRRRMRKTRYLPYALNTTITDRSHNRSNSRTEVYQD